MKKTFFLITLVILFFVSCKESNEVSLNIEDNTLKQHDYTESEQLLYYLEKYGNYINSEEVPSLITHQEAFKNINNPEYYYIDIRNFEDFKNGHISRAYHVNFEDLLNYLENEIKVSHYEKIIIICKAGQSASYATGLLRILGYNNVYSLKWGMSAWNREFSDVWLDNISGNFKSEFDTVKTSKKPHSGLPVIKTGSAQPEQILYKRVKSLFNEGLKTFKVNRNKIIENASNYYIVDYVDEFKHNLIHFKGSVQYQPESSLLSSTDLRTLPLDQEIVVYCMTGHKSAFLTAYLKILGYNARSLVFGRNGMIHETMKNKGWPHFSNELINNYPFIIGEETEEPLLNQDEQPVLYQDDEPTIVLPSNSNKDKSRVSGGCG